MKGSNVISALKKKLKASTDRALADKLGITAQAIQNWKKRKTVTERQVAGLINSSRRASAIGSIRPLVEFFHIGKCESKKGANYEVFSCNDGDGDRHPYLEGLRGELEAYKGVYLFFDSRGHAIYTGKARRQSLWKEINLAFNRARGEVQKIKRVPHPTRRQIYRTSEEKTRQIIDQEVPLYELASYFSAYQVADGLINQLEATLVRSFANDLLNKRMERFGHHRRKRKST